ncbi:cystathionine beta-lyase [Clostridia bacterium]|nr:cystathionine beta-lyase [Clostridia bacterium]
MPQFDFDKRLDFSGIDSAKWGGDKELLPLWVADMDFETVPAVKQALLDRAAFGVYGYTKISKDYIQSIAAWQKTRHGWDIKPEWIVHTPGVINAIFTTLRAFSQEGDYVLINTPVYHPFYHVINASNRKALENPLIDNGGGYDIDFGDFEKKIAENKPKIFLLCSPHNPIGKVYSADELERFGNICKKYGVLVISDEIHGDLTAPGVRHVPFGSVGDFAENSVICTAPSKTFNLAGLHHSNIIIPSADIRSKFTAAQASVGTPGPGLFALFAGAAAYKEGAVWLDEVRAYIQANREFAEKYIAENIPLLKAYSAKGTYFLWLDFRKLGFDKEKLEEFLQKKAKVWFNQGYAFGEKAAGFARVNIACPRSLLKEALDRVKAAL